MSANNGDLCEFRRRKNFEKRAGVIPPCKRGGKLVKLQKDPRGAKTTMTLPKNEVPPMTCYAKSKNAAGKQQTNKEHLQAVADLAFCYGQALGLGEQ